MLLTVLWVQPADQGQQFLIHCFLVKHFQAGLFFADHHYICFQADMVLMGTEAFSDQSLDSVTPYRRTDFPGDRNTHPEMLQAVFPDKQDEGAGMITAAL